jgi:hypothetical protein
MTALLDAIDYGGWLAVRLQVQTHAKDLDDLVRGHPLQLGPSKSSYGFIGGWARERLPWPAP